MAKYWSFSFSISPSNDCLGLASFTIDWLDLLAIQGTHKSLLQQHSSKASILQCSALFIVQLSYPYMTTGKTIALTRWTFSGKVMSLLFNMLFRLVMSFSGDSDGKASAYNAGDPGSIPGSGKSPGEGNGNPFQYSCLENPMDRGAWWATVHGVAKSQTRLSDFTHTHTHTHRLVIAFLPRSKCLLIPWLQSPSAQILEPRQKIKSLTVSIVSPSICHEVMGLDAMILVAWMLSFKPTFSLSSFTYIKRLFSSSSFSAIRVVSSAYLRLLILFLESWFQFVLHPVQHFALCTMHRS